MDRLMAGVVSLVALIPPFFTNDLTTPILGVGVSTVAGAVCGTYAALGFDESSAAKPRGRIFTLATATVITASMMVGVVPKMFGFEWDSSKVEGGLAGLMAWGVYYLLPIGIKRAGELLASIKLSDIIPFMRARNSIQTPPADNAPPKREDPDQ